MNRNFFYILLVCFLILSVFKAYATFIGPTYSEIDPWARQYCIWTDGNGTVIGNYTFTNYTSIYLVNNSLLWDGHAFSNLISQWINDVGYYNSSTLPTSHSFTGLNLTGSDSQINRTIIVPNVNLLTVDGFTLEENHDYVYNGTTLIFLNKIWDEQRIIIFY